jgi:hypothetical protein
VLPDILHNGLLFKLEVVLCSPCWLYKYAHQPVLTFLLIIYSHFFLDFELDICNPVSSFCICVMLFGFSLQRSTVLFVQVATCHMQAPVLTSYIPDILGASSFFSPPLLPAFWKHAHPQQSGDVSLSPPGTLLNKNS